MCESQTPFSQNGNKLLKRSFPVDSHIYIAHEIYHVLSVSVYNTINNLETALAGGIGTDVTCQLVTKRFDPI